MHKQIDFNDLKYVATVANAGTLAGAARILNVNHATVFRRIEGIEQQLGVRLFERDAGRYLPTLAGEELARAGRAMAHEVNESLRKVAGSDLSPKGIVRITTTTTFAQAFLGDCLQQCQSLYPDIHIELILAQEYLNLSKRDADIAIRPTLSPPEHLIGKCIAPMFMAVYASKDYIKKHLSDTALPLLLSQLPQFDWVTIDDTFSQSHMLKWLTSVISIEKSKLRCNQMTGIHWGCKLGLGMALLPCFIGDNDSDLQRVTETITDCASELWILMHPDLRATTRVKTVFDMLYQSLQQQSKALSGNLCKS